LKVLFNLANAGEARPGVHGCSRLYSIHEDGRTAVETSRTHLHARVAIVHSGPHLAKPITIITIIITGAHIEV
jgi:hypothetical protein